jgi:YrbI family 3-deoxy-D-manno-octulosonate 8-phosphate phosphatase
VAIIPARGGSKGVPGKNVAPVGGVPLVARAIRSARLAGVEAVYVSTDDADIARVTREAGAEVIDRPQDLAVDTASSESALLHALEVLSDAGVNPDVVVFLQATSPFIDPSALGEAIDRVVAGSEDVVFSAFETYAFLWRLGSEGATGVNHDESHRPRRQDREPHYQESGAFYVMRADGFRDGGYRFFGRVGVQEVSERTAIEIDFPDELQMSRQLASMFDQMPTVVDIDALVMDFDGVHTDDLVSVSSTGEESVRVSRSDGMGIGMLRQAGLPMLILSKEQNLVVSARGSKLGVEVRQGIDDKLSELERWANDLGLALSRIAYVGNDVNDSACLRAVGWPTVVPEAHWTIKNDARILLTRPGGRGALRELAELILAGRKGIN